MHKDGDFLYLWGKISKMNIKLGKYNQLEVVKTVDFGVYLDGGDAGEILLPTRYVPEGCNPGDILNVFIYLDNEERLIATTLQPLVQVDEFACLEVAWVNEYGAFLDWGLMKDLFVPFREQKMKMQKGRRYVVHAHVDEESYRIMASAKIERYLCKEKPSYQVGEELNVMVWHQTDLGFKVIVENKFSGMLYRNEVFQPLEPGMIITVEPGLYIKELGIGIRIEDDILVTKTGNMNLSIQIPKNAAEIERLLASRGN